MTRRAIIKIEIEDLTIKKVWAKSDDDEYHRIILLPNDSEALVKLLSKIIVTHASLFKPRRAIIEADMEMGDDTEKT